MYSMMQQQQQQQQSRDMNGNHDHAESGALPPQQPKRETSHGSSSRGQQQQQQDEEHLVVVPTLSVDGEEELFVMGQRHPKQQPQRNESFHSSSSSSSDDSETVLPGAYVVPQDGVPMRRPGFGVPAEYQYSEYDAGTITGNTIKTPIAVAAELSEDAHARLEEQIRHDILQNAVQASAVVVAAEGDENNKPAVAPPTTKTTSTTPSTSGDQQPRIRKRRFLPWDIKRTIGSTSDWVVSIETSQEALLAEDYLARERYSRVYATSSEQQAKEMALAMAVPKMDDVKKNPKCFVCDTKFTLFRRPLHCRNCGVVMCSSCSTTWPSKMLPETYPRKKKTTVTVCAGCHWLARKFQNALLSGNYQKAMDLYKSGNINTRTPCCIDKKAEDLYPVHSVIIGKNLKLARWLVNHRCCPLQTDLPRNNNNATTSNKQSQPTDTRLLTSKGRSLIELALGNVEMLHFLVAEQGLDLLLEPQLNYRLLLTNLSYLLRATPKSNLLTNNNNNNKVVFDVSAVPDLQQKQQPSSWQQQQKKTMSSINNHRDYGGYYNDHNNNNNINNNTPNSSSHHHHHLVLDVSAVPDLQQQQHPPFPSTLDDNDNNEEWNGRSGNPNNGPRRLDDSSNHHLVETIDSPWRCSV